MLQKVHTKNRKELLILYTLHLFGRNINDRCIHQYSSYVQISVLLGVDPGGTQMGC